MTQFTQNRPDRSSILCVDTYQDGILRGRLYDPLHNGEAFRSLSQFLLKMEAFLNQHRNPQSCTTPRRFPVFLPPEEFSPPEPVRPGRKATFELQVLFRQHTSWQGTLLWREENIRQPFRSVLELVLLLDSALRATEGSGAA